MTDRRVMSNVELRRMLYAAFCYMAQVARLNMPEDADDTMRELLEQVLSVPATEEVEK